VVREVEVERPRPVLLGLEVQVPARAVGLGAAGRVRERNEQAVVVGARHPIGRQGERHAGDLEAEDARPLRRSRSTIGRRDLEMRRPRAGIALQDEALQDQVRIDIEVGQPGEHGPVGCRDGTVR
jgi:hypothetical protein